MKALIINLKSAKDRYLFQKKQLNLYSIDYEFINAISSKDISYQNFIEFSQDWQRPLLKSELACFYSHRNIWLHIANSHEPYLIIEDDALLSKEIINILPILEKKNGVDLINFENRGRRKFLSRTKEKLINNHKMIRLFQDRTGAACYVLWPSGAKKLLNFQSKNGIALTDALITSCHDLICFQVEPALAVQLDYCEFYGLKNPTNINSSQSSVSRTKNKKGSLKFWFRRIYFQIKLGYRNMLLMVSCDRRYVEIIKSDFFGN